jgi:hypothetical protein
VECDYHVHVIKQQMPFCDPTLLLHGQFPEDLAQVLPQFQAEACVLWNREHGVAGCEFVRIPPVDRDILREWLSNQCKVQKPAIAVEGPQDRLELKSC